MNKQISQNVWTGLHSWR